jgi:hypothetical protein
MDSSKTVTARFVQQQYTITASADPSNGGNVTGAGTFVAGSQVTLQATSNSGWSFAGWSGTCDGTGSCAVTMDSSKTVTAGFVQQQYSIIASANPSNGGSVTGVGNYTAGSEVSLQATPDSGWVFAGWSGPAPAPALARWPWTPTRLSPPASP